MGRLLLVAGLVVFVIAALIGVTGWGTVSVTQLLGLVAIGLACWIAAALP